MLPAGSSPPGASPEHPGYTEDKFRLSVVRFILRYYASMHFFRIAQLMKYGVEHYQRFRAMDRTSLYMDSILSSYDWNFGRIYARIRLKYDNVYPHQESVIANCLQDQPYVEQWRIRTFLPFEETTDREAGPLFC